MSSLPPLLHYRCIHPANENSSNSRPQNQKRSQRRRNKIPAYISFPPIVSSITRPPPSSNSFLSKSILQITSTHSLTVCNLTNQSAQIYSPASKQASKQRREGKEVNSIKFKITQRNPTIETEKDDRRGKKTIFPTPTPHNPNAHQSIEPKKHENPPIHAIKKKREKGKK